MPMDNVNGPGSLFPPGLLPQAAPQNAPAAVTNAPPPLTADQFRPTAAAQAQDPQKDAIFAVYSATLAYGEPIQVSQALAALEGLGAAFRDRVIATIKASLTPGQPPMKSLVLLDALERMGATDALPQVQAMLNDPDPEVRATATKQFGRLAGITTHQPAAPTPAQQPGAGPQPAAPGNAAMDTWSRAQIDRMRRFPDLPTVCLELAQLPMNQLGPLLTTLAADMSFDDDRAFNLLTKAVAARVREPGAVDALRAVLNRPGELSSTDMSFAKSRAALATLHFGTPSDQAGYLRLLVDRTSRVGYEQMQVLIKSLGARPDLLRERAATVALASILNRDLVGIEIVKAASAKLAETNTPLAWQALGEAKYWRESLAPEQYRFFLSQLEKAPKPLSPGTIATLQKIQAGATDAGQSSQGQRSIYDWAKELIAKSR